MDTFRAHHADILDPAQQSRVIALLRDHGLVTFTGITGRTSQDEGALMPNEMYGRTELEWEALEAAGWDFLITRQMTAVVAWAKTI